MTCRPKPTKTPEQMERERKAAQEAVRRHRKRRRMQKDAIGVRRHNAMKRVNAGMQELIFGKNGRKRDTTHHIATDLFYALGPEAAARVRDYLNAELAVPAEERQRKELEIAQWLHRAPAEVAA